MPKTKTFVRGSVREKVFDNGGRVLNVSVNIDDLTAYASNKGYVPIVVAERAKEDEYGNTHYMYIDDYSLEKQREYEQAKKEPQQSAGSERENPFR